MKIALRSASAQPLLISMSQQQAGTRSIPFSHPTHHVTEWQSEKQGGAELTKHCRHCCDVLCLAVGAACCCLVSLQSPKLRRCSHGEGNQSWIECQLGDCDWLVLPAYPVVVVELWRLWVCVWVCCYLTLYSLYTALLWGQSASALSERLQLEIKGCSLLCVLPGLCTHCKPFAIFYIQMESLNIFLDISHFDDLSKWEQSKHHI